LLELAKRRRRFAAISAADGVNLLAGCRHPPGKKRGVHFVPAMRNTCFLAVLTPFLSLFYVVLRLRVNHSRHLEVYFDQVAR
jgi:hypothetical protein